MRILGIDPGTLKMGYGVLEDSEEGLSTLDYGALAAPSRMPPAQRLHRLYLGLMKLVAQYKPHEMAIEEPFVSQTDRRNARSALAVGRAQAVAMLVAADHDIPIHTYPPAKVKQLVTDHGGSDKEQVQRMVSIHLGLSQLVQPSDAADALAVALCHVQQKRLAKLLEKGNREPK